LLRKIDEERKTGGNYLFYMATAPEFFGTITQQLKDSELTTESEGHWRRAVYEKPFGHDLASAKALNKELLGLLQEKQIYRSITIWQGNGSKHHGVAFWQRHFRADLESQVYRSRANHRGETVGVELRGGYYNQAARCGIWSRITCFSW